MRLSPLNASGMRGMLTRIVNDEEPETVYRCPVCAEDHEERSWAEECCADEKNLTVDESAKHCPVCSKELAGAEYAADCCLWKDLPHAARQRIARAVVAGAAWSEAIAKETQ